MFFKRRLSLHWGVFREEHNVVFIKRSDSGSSYSRGSPRVQNAPVGISDVPEACAKAKLLLRPIRACSSSSGIRIWSNRSPLPLLRRSPVLEARCLLANLRSPCGSKECSLELKAVLERTSDRDGSATASFYVMSQPASRAGERLTRWRQKPPSPRLAPPPNAVFSM